MRVIDHFGSAMETADGATQRELAQGYVSFLIYDATTGEKIKRITHKNTVVNDARRAAARNFAGFAGDLIVDRYRCGYSDVLTNHWDAVNDRAIEVPFTDNTPLPEYNGSQSVNFFHTQAGVNPADGRQWMGAGNPLDTTAIALNVDYPFNSDEYAVRLYLELPGNISSGATFDTVEIILTNGWRFAARWVYPIVKQPNWGLAIEHLVLF